MLEKIAAKEEIKSPLLDYKSSPVDIDSSIFRAKSKTKKRKPNKGVNKKKERRITRLRSK